MKFLLAICAVFVQSVLFACGGISQQVYSGKIEYTLNPANPLRCNIIITLDFDVNELTQNDSIWVDWGDYAITTIHALSITEDSIASAAMGNTTIYTHKYAGSHIYAAPPPSGYYFISFQNEYRINGVTNIAGGGGVNLPFYLMAQVSIDTSAQGYYGPLQFPALSIGFAGLSSYAQNGLQQTDDSGDSSAYSFTTPLETVSNPVPEYQTPDQFCIANGSSSNAFGIDPTTGNLSWSNACLQGIYCYGTLLSKYRNGQLISSIMREQNIYVTAGSTTGIANITDNTSMQTYPNPAQNTLAGNVSFGNGVTEGLLDIVAPDGRVAIRNITVKGGRFESDISKLAAGIYFVSMHSTEGTITQKFIKQ